MRFVLPASIIVGLFGITARADCRHPNGNLQTDLYHASCAGVLDNPLNTMCCAIERPNPSEGLSQDGLTADVCLPNGLCKQSSRQDENSSVITTYFREECTVADWKSGKCLSICLSNSVSRNVEMTPCDGTANSTRWCCGNNEECCAGDIGVETLAQTFVGMLASATMAPSSSATVSDSSFTAASNTSPSNTAAPVSSETSSRIPPGAIAGIVIGAFAAVTLAIAAWFLVAHRRRSAASPPPTYVEAGHAPELSKTVYHHEADGAEPQVSEVSAANKKDHDGRTRVFEM
ncbi:hypothetical protein OPT61_g5613 [Boeremia exigua]|uniref:Uncharacterized protein n=1 Tax=Boeremia exigua TaxID=749465 RepID=A0ACC2I9N7_9PLEO|nr:hypothetical protein OPT61_g5613 [Boeremia exigua]